MFANLYYAHIIYMYNICRGYALDVYAICQLYENSASLNCQVLTLACRSVNNMQNHTQTWD